MVRFLFMLLIFFSPMVAQEVKVIAQVDDERIEENQPIDGTISVTHDENLKIDPSSFQLGKQKIKTEFVRDVKISPTDPLTISIYKFQLGAQPKGLQVLPEVSVKVGGKTYLSPPSTYEVRAASSAPNSPRFSHSTPQATQTKPAAPASLKLEALVEGKSQLFPGERTKLVYRYLFTGDIALTSEKLPLLDAEGMIKVGEKEIKDFVEGKTNIREISQQVEAAKAGEFVFGPSVIEGFATDTKEKFRSEAPAVKIHVLPFPGQEKPPAFNGAIGRFTFSTSLQSPKSVDVGDEMTLLVEISGTGNLEKVNLPEICCQPGMSGFFQMSDLPPVGTIKGNVKQFLVQLRPLTNQIKEIPSLAFAFYNPETGIYTTLNSQPIPITVRAPKQPMPPQGPLPPTSPAVPTLSVVAPQAIEVEKIDSLKAGDLSNKRFGTWWALAIIPFGIALLIYQLSLQEHLKRRAALPKKQSGQELMEEALKLDETSPSFFINLSKALKAISQERPGLAPVVQQLIQDIEENRFSGFNQFSPAELKKRAETILQSIRR